MIYNTILVHLDIGDGAPPQLNFARELAARFEASLVGFAASDVHPISAPPPGVVVDAEFMRLEAREIEHRLEALRSDLDASGEMGGTDSLRTTVGDPTRGLATAARAADLVIAGPGGVGGRDARTAIDLGALIHAAGRPVLIPRDDLAPLNARSVVVAWKDAREARRAVADAMPFLVHAREVVVATVAEREPDRAMASATDVVRYLINHGAKARAEIVDHGEGEAGEALIDIAKQRGADLIVSGGYGHGRLREWLLGGVTRSLLREVSLHRLMSA
ncbi:universal stress protein [Sinorhizobium sp. 7-81]|uniref:universal stress protein n=1 Tax=Sinorhizobium sp. 8-89 TaxID=3049089 RepID=UPI0024C3F5FB|nr:universal stress protein [Sinorhizobium sp. 8-89]MDK1491227.1 universal stress protein [Sinorhizobium sp. 8-89]